MAEVNYNIKQITNYDIVEAPSITRTISVPVRSTIPDESGRYPIRFEDQNIPYKTALENVELFKLGYCCEYRGIIYPIFIQINGEYEEIKIGKECMYEFQPEDWTDINTEDPQVKTSDVIVTAVQVPADIEFTLDYAIE